MARVEEEGSMKAGGPDDPEKDKNDEGKGSHGEVGDQINREKISTDAALKESREDKDLNSESKTGDRFHTNRAEQHPGILCIARGQVDKIEPPNDPQPYCLPLRQEYLITERQSSPTYW